MLPLVDKFRTLNWVEIKKDMEKLLEIDVIRTCLMAV
jgi:hypothetical protein